MRADAAWLLTFAAVAATSCVLGEGQSVSGPRVRAEARYEPLDSDSVEAAAAKALQGVIDGITAVKGSYPELSEWDLREPEALGGGYSLDYSHNYLWRPGKMTRPRVGEHGCHIAVSVGFGAYATVPQEPMQYWFPDLRVTVRTSFGVGNGPSDGFTDEIWSILARFITTLGQLDRDARADRQDSATAAEEAGRQLSPEEVRAAIEGVLQGIIGDISAIKSRYRELAEWNVEAPGHGGFTYQYRFSGAAWSLWFGQHGCHLGAWLRPASDPPPLMRNPRYRFPNLGAFGHTWIFAGDDASEGFCAEVQAIFVKHIAVLEEAERRAAAATVPREP